MNKYEVLTVLKDAQEFMSPVEIARAAMIDAPSEVLNSIKDTCWDLVEDGWVIATPLDVDRNRNYTFKMKNG